VFLYFRGIFTVLDLFNGSNIAPLEHVFIVLDCPWRLLVGVHRSHELFFAASTLNVLKVAFMPFYLFDIIFGQQTLLVLLKTFFIFLVHRHIVGGIEGLLQVG
jgi:hypothetical protein